MIGSVTIKNILDAQKKFEHTDDISEYIQEVLKDIKDIVSPKGIYARVYLYDNSPFQTIKLFDQADIHPNFFDKLSRFESETIDKNTLTKALLENTEKDTLCLYKNKNEEDKFADPTVWSVNFAKPSRREQLPARSFVFYKENIKHGWHLYFIKPYSFSEYLNAVICVATSGKMSPEQIHICRFLLTQTIAPIAVKKLQKSEWDKIAEEQAHTANTDLTILKDTIRRISLNDSRPYEKKLLQKASSKITALHQLNQYCLAVMKTQNGKVDCAKYPILDIERINLRTTLSSIISDLSSDLDGIAKNRTHKIKLEQMLPDLISKSEKLPDIEIRGTKAGIEIIFRELIKNALSHSLKDNPKVWIDFIIDNNLNIKIYNNGTMTEDAKRFIDNRRDSQNVYRKLMAGVRTIFRIIGTKHFWNWGLYRDMQNTDNITGLIIKIPKSVINE